MQTKLKAAVLKQHLFRLIAAKILAIPPEKSASYYHSFIYYYEATLVDLQDQLTSLGANRCVLLRQDQPETV